MFAKVFAQIFDSSIAEDPTVRYGFMDLLVLADSEGVVDMTAQAISRRTNVPLDTVIAYLAALSEPDPRSRSKKDGGARIKLLDSHRDWGWQIINYQHYRELRDEEARKAYFRDRKRAQRLKVSKLSNRVQSCPPKSTKVTHAEEEEEGKRRGNGLSSADVVLRSKELDRVAVRMKEIRSSYESHQAWSDPDRAEFTKLKARRAELKAILGVVA